MSNVVWYARGEGIARSGPFKTQLEASKYLMNKDGFPIPGAYTWPQNSEKDTKELPEEPKKVQRKSKRIKEEALKPGDIFESRNGNRYLVLPSLEQMYIGNRVLWRIPKEAKVDSRAGNEVNLVSHLDLPYEEE